jgi:putative transposase
LYGDRVAVTGKVRRYSGGVYDLGLHVVWCPKYRRRVLDGRVAVRPRELNAQKAAEKDWEIVALEVMPDQVHMLIKHEPKASPVLRREPVQGFHLACAAPGVWAPEVADAPTGAAGGDAG